MKQHKQPWSKFYSFDYIYVNSSESLTLMNTGFNLFLWKANQNNKDGDIC